jgi:Skp family chaperone for outer membrane proteins
MNVAERLQLQMDSIVRPLREEAQELIDYAQSDQATEDDINVASQRLGEIEQAVKQLQAREQQIMGNMERQLQAQVAQRLEGELEAYAEQTGIDVIVNWGLSGEGVLYGREGFNITRPLIVFLNDRVEQPALEADTTATVATP